MSVITDERSIAMSEFAKTLQGFVAHMPDGPDKIEAQKVLEDLPDLAIEIVAEERANKEMPKLREDAITNGQAFVIARAGRVENLQQAAFVISSKAILSIAGSVRSAAERKARRRRPTSALLAQLKPLDPSVVNMRIGTRLEDETLGGRGKVF